MNVNKEKGKRKTRKCTEQRNRIENGIQKLGNGATKNNQSSINIYICNMVGRLVGR